MATLPSTFLFSQSSLQDFADCPRRFQLRHLRRCSWPAVQTEPLLEAERHMERGHAFHRLAHQRHLGLDEALLREAALGAGLEDWWESLLDHGPAGLPDSRYAECSLATPLAGHTLIAKYDLIAAEPGRLVIVDWKTSLRRPSRAGLQTRLQTHVYPYVLAMAGGRLTGQPVEPGQVEMHYWFAEFPDQPELFRYSAEMCEQDAARLAGLIREIAACPDDGFPQAADDRSCRYCVYRSLCEREARAGAFDQAEDDIGDDLAEDAEIRIDIQQVAEIAY